MTRKRCLRPGCRQWCKDTRGIYCGFACAGFMKRKPPRLCARPGCGGVLTNRRLAQRWCSRACIDWRTGNIKRGYTIRRKKFADELLKLSGRTLTRAELLAVFAVIDRRAFQRGWKTRDKGLAMDWDTAA